MGYSRAKDRAKKLRMDAANLFRQFYEKFWRKINSSTPGRWLPQASAK